MKKLLLLISISILIISVAFIFNSLRPVGKENKQEVILLTSDSPDAAAVNLEDAGLIRSFNVFTIAYQILGKGKIKPGGYYFSENMGALKIINKLNNGPDLKQIMIPEGLRKEQIG